jgi:hypothetical protein
MLRWNVRHGPYLLTVLGVASLLAQGSPPAVGKVPDSGSKHLIRPVKLTPEQQRGVRLLKAAESEASSLQPDMAAFVLWRVATGYAKIDRDKADRMLSRAFLTTESMEHGPDDEFACQDSPVCRTKNWLQTSLLHEIIARAPEQGEQLLASADPLPRAQATSALAERYVEKKNFARTEALLTRLADEDNYPFGVAAKLLLAMPKDSPELLPVFSQALENFQQHKHNATPQLEDFPTMLVRFLRHLPPATALSAVDVVLHEAKDVDEKQGQFRISFSTQQGPVGFTSVYQLRLFQMLPVVEELDKDHAESLLRENSETQANLKRYPQGMQSLDPGNYRDANPEKRQTGIYTVEYSVGDAVSDPTRALKEQLQNDLDRRMNLISSESSKDPKQALTDAMNLPQENPVNGRFDSPRLAALVEVAKATMERDPMVARAALDELRRNMDGTHPLQQGLQLVEATRLYLKLNEIESARKALQELLKTAERVYAVDTNADDPNKAFKGKWPSAALWFECMQLAGRISPELVDQVAFSVTDPEIAAAVRVAYANSLLGSQAGSSEVEEWHKSGQRVSFFEP